MENMEFDWLEEVEVLDSAIVQCGDKCAGRAHRPVNR